LERFRGFFSFINCAVVFSHGSPHKMLKGDDYRQ
jgi:hypothetical protein